MEKREEEGGVLKDTLTVMLGLFLKNRVFASR